MLVEDISFVGVSGYIWHLLYDLKIYAFNEVLQYRFF